MLFSLWCECVVMRSPSIAPGFNADVYLVLDDFGKIGRAYWEAVEIETDRATIIRRLIEGQYEEPVRVVAFNTSEGWSRDVTAEIAREIKDWSERKGEELSPRLKEWVDYQIDLAARSQQYAVASWCLRSLS
jgi:hypothetical protein